MNCAFTKSDPVSLKTDDLRLRDQQYRPIKLYLNANSIERIEKNKLLFGHEDWVEWIILNDNRLSWIQSGGFDKFRVLKQLHLNNNFLKFPHGAK